MPGFISVGSAVPVPRQAPAITPYGTPPELPQDATPEQLEKAVRTLLRDVYSPRPENRTPESLHRSQLADGINATAESAFSHQMGEAIQDTTYVADNTTATLIPGLEWTVTVPVESRVMLAGALEVTIAATGGTGSLSIAAFAGSTLIAAWFFLHPTAATTDKFIIPIVGSVVLPRRSSTVFQIRARTTHVSNTYTIPYVSARLPNRVAWYAQPVHRGQR